MEFNNNVSAFSPIQPDLYESKELEWIDIPKTHRKDGDYIYVMMNNNDMYDRYLKDDIVIIKIQDECPDDGDALLSVNDTVMLKHIKPADGKYSLTNLNPFDDSEDVLDEAEVTIIGVPVSVMRVS